MTSCAHRGREVQVQSPMGVHLTCVPCVLWWFPGRTKEWLRDRNGQPMRKQLAQFERVLLDARLRERRYRARRRGEYLPRLRAA